MTGYAAYKQVQAMPMTRIDLILTLYRRAMENLKRARQALEQNDRAAARPRLAQTQLIVAALSSELPAYKTEAAVNFLRLYEFVAHQMTLETVAGVDAAVRVLTPLLAGFEAVREKAVALELQGEIPPLDEARLVSIKA